MWVQQPSSSSCPLFSLPWKTPISSTNSASPGAKDTVWVTRPPLTRPTRRTPRSVCHDSTHPIASEILLHTFTTVRVKRQKESWDHCKNSFNLTGLVNMSEGYPGVPTAPVQVPNWPASHWTVDSTQIPSLWVPPLTGYLPLHYSGRQTRRHSANSVDLSNWWKAGVQRQILWISVLPRRVIGIICKLLSW